MSVRPATRTLLPDSGYRYRLAVHDVGRVGPVGNEVGVVPAVLDHHVGQGEGERRVGPGSNAQPVVGLGGKSRLAGVDHDQLGTPPDRGDGAGPLGDLLLDMGVGCLPAFISSLGGWTRLGERRRRGP